MKLFGFSLVKTETIENIKEERENLLNRIDEIWDLYTSLKDEKCNYENLYIYQTDELEKLSLMIEELTEQIERYESLLFQVMEERSQQTTELKSKIVSLASDKWDIENFAKKLERLLKTAHEDKERLEGECQKLNRKWLRFW